MEKPTSFSKEDYEIIKCDVLHQRFFRLLLYRLRHKKFDGHWSEAFDRELFEQGSAVGVLPYDPMRNQVVLIEQFRIGTIQYTDNPWTIEIPCGLLMQDEEPMKAASRETNEEVGCTILDFHPIYTYFGSPGSSNECVHLFCGLVDSKDVHGVHGVIDENEDIHALTLSTSEAFEWLETGKIKTAPAMIALQWLQLNQERLKEKWQGK